jgi:Ca2+-binding RTX toxin-like protein
VLVAVLAVTGALALSSAGPAQSAAPVTCGGRVATIVGTVGRDVLRGTDGDDVIAALGGDDVVLGMGGNDIICGGHGRDVVNGGRGQDACAGDVVQCEGRLLGASDFPFTLELDQKNHINRRDDNGVVVELDPFDTPTSAIWVNVAFVDDEQFNGTDASSDWRCSSLTSGLPRPATGGIACEYIGNTPHNPGLLIYVLGVNLPQVPKTVYLQYCGSSTAGDFTNDGCLVPRFQTTVVAP